MPVSPTDLPGDSDVSRPGALPSACGSLRGKVFLWRPISETTNGHLDERPLKPTHRSQTHCSRASHWHPTSISKPAREVSCRNPMVYRHREQPHFNRPWVWGLATEQRTTGGNPSLEKAAPIQAAPRLRILPQLLTRCRPSFLPILRRRTLAVEGRSPAFRAFSQPHALDASSCH